jgi:hypothetical protein
MGCLFAENTKSLAACLAMCTCCPPICVAACLNMPPPPWCCWAHPPFAPRTALVCTPHQTGGAAEGKCSFQVPGNVSVGMCESCPNADGCPGCDKHGACEEGCHNAAMLIGASTGSGSRLEGAATCVATGDACLICTNCPLCCSGICSLGGTCL